MTTRLQSGGELLTKEYLDLRLDALRGDIRKETTRLILWLVPTVFGGRLQRELWSGWRVDRPAVCRLNLSPSE